MGTHWTDQLATNWQQLCSGLSLSGRPIEAAYALLCERYCEPGRYYHTLEHLAAMFAILDGLDLPQAKEPPLHLAVWYHDAVYDSRAEDNEERSADLARSQLGQLHLPLPVIEETARLIHLTKRHATTSEDHVGQLLLDTDLAILGAAPDVYDQFARAIRQEYAWVAEDAYRQGRSEVLQRFLQRLRIYGTPPLYDRYEQQARHNLTREVASLLGKGNA